MCCDMQAVSNACFPPHVELVQLSISPEAEPSAATRFAHSVFDHVCQRSCCDGDVRLQPGRGAPQGGASSTRIFNPVYWDALEQFDMCSTRSITYAHWHNAFVWAAHPRGHHTVLADDMYASRGDDARPHLRQICFKSRQLGLQQQPFGPHQNRGNMECVFRMRGAGAHTGIKQLRIAHSRALAEVLGWGPQLHLGYQVTAEVKHATMCQPLLFFRAV